MIKHLGSPPYGATSNERPDMMSVNILDFLPHPPCLRNMNLIYTIKCMHATSLTTSAFSLPPPPPMRTSYMEAPLL